MEEIGKILGMSTGKIHKYFHIYDIETREDGSKSDIARKKISNAQKGKKYALGIKRTEEYKEKISIANSAGIGNKNISKTGYVRIYFPDHPKSDSYGYIFEHDLIMECFIGRWLKNDEVVHHVNGIKTDNRIKNLKLMTRSEHMKLHRIERLKKQEAMTYQ